MTDTPLTQAPYASKFKNLSDLKAQVGKELGLTDWIVMDQERINSFAEATEDMQWIHTDVARSQKESPYKTTIAHGFLVLSMASKFAYEAYSMDDVVMGVNYGLDKVRFPHATPSGAALRGRITMMEYEDIPGGAKYKIGIIFEIKGQSKPACVAEFLAIAYTASDTNLPN